MLTNFATISSRIGHLEILEKDLDENKYMIKKEKLAATEERDKLQNVLGGIREMKKTPDALFIIDILREKNAVREAKKLGIPVVGMVDTNANPEDIKYSIPSNDDAIKSIQIITGAIADTIFEAKGTIKEGGE